MADNPYEAPTSELSITHAPKFFLWGVATVFVSAGLGGMIGCLIGLLLGRIMPGYYRSVFHGGHEPGFDPVAVGIGQGLSQGILFGGLIGLAVVGIYSWYRSRAIRESR